MFAGAGDLGPLNCNCKDVAFLNCLETAEKLSYLLQILRFGMAVCAVAYSAVSILSFGSKT